MLHLAPLMTALVVAAGPTGTHFIGELHLGSTIYGHAAAAVGLGAGGRVPGLETRVYLFGEAGATSDSSQGVSPTTRVPWRDRRTLVDLLMGLRAYVPLRRGVRILGEILAGATRVDATLYREGYPPRSGLGYEPAAGIGLGLQYRIRWWLSLGLQGRLMLSDDDVAGLRTIVGARTRTRGTLSGGVTWHF